MNSEQRLNAWLKSGIAANGFYLALMTLPLVSTYLTRREAGSTSIHHYLKELPYFFLSDYLVLLSSTPKLLYSSSPAVHTWFFLGLLIFFALSIVGAKRIADGRNKNGANLILISCCAFFPLGIIGLIGAWFAKSDTLNVYQRAVFFVISLLGYILFMAIVIGVIIGLFFLIFRM